MTLSPQLAIPQLSRTGSLAEQVRDSIFSAILAGSLPPRTRLREIPLSAHFGLSKTPVREALRQLEAEGLVVVHPRRGAVVTSLDETAVRNLYDLRLILEVAAVRRAAESGEAPTRAEEIVQEMDGHLSDESQLAFHRLDVRLHRSIAEMTGNVELADAVERTHQRIQSARVRVAVRGRLTTAQKQHKKIISAIGHGHPDAAESAVTEHITSAREHVLKFLDSHDPTSADRP